MALLLLLSSVFLAFLLSRCFSFYRNYQNARTLGLPMVFSPVDPRNILWQIVQPRIMPLLRLLPESLIQFAIISNPTSAFRDKAAVHRRLGPAFVLVSPGINHIMIADPDAVTTILTKRKEFPKPDLYDILNVFGRNVDTVNGEEWTRHRKLTASCFNERISSYVWDESLRQAEAMRSHWLKADNGKVRGMVEDTRIIALHVLSAAGFGVRQDFNEGVRKAPDGHTMSFRDSLMLVLFNLVLVLTFSFNLNLMLKSFMPKKVQRVGTAVKEFRQYMNELLDRERQAMTTPQGAAKPNLINTLIRESDEAKATVAGKNPSLLRLSDDEIKGNIFIFSLAGHDTTANTLAYALCLLAIHPEYQTWLAEELDHVRATAGETADYEAIFPRLKRCQAVMVSRPLPCPALDPPYPLPPSPS
ncbi:cytochrome P450, partial [Glonium stellatum]